ncbi:ATP-binding protein [Methylomagnum sp.]
MDKKSLRTRAETELQARIESLGPDAVRDEAIAATRDELRALLHEIQVYEAELEIQNQELREAQAELEKSRDRYADLFDFSPLGYVVLDPNGVILESNLTAAGLLQRARGRLVGYPLLTFVAAEDRPVLLDHLRRCRQREKPAVISELRILSRDGGSRPVELYSVAESSGGRYRTALRCIVELELRRARDELERRVAERTAELETANAALRVEIGERERLEQALRHRNEALAEADRHKDDFMAMLAHELRNPLAAIANAGEVLRRHTQAQAQDDICGRVAQIIGRQVVHFKVMLDDLLDVARVTQGKVVLNRQVVALSDIAAQAVETHRAAIEAHAHHFTVSLPDPPILLDADFTRCVQIVGNLLHNAAKFTPPGGRIELVVRREGGEAVIHIRDNGVGIPADLVGRVFEPFTQEDRSLARASGGLGLGLALVRRLVEMHGGRVDASSGGIGQGSEFTVWLPVSGGLPEADSA